MKIEITKILAVRTLMVVLIAVFLIFLPSYGLLYGMTSAVNINGASLISPLEYFLLLLTTKTFPTNLIIPAITSIIVIVIFGRFFCGWICPTGIILEYTRKLSTKKDRRTRHLDWIGWKNRERYAILFAVLAASLLFNFAAPYLFSPPGVFYRMAIYFALQGVIGVDLLLLALIIIIDTISLRYGRTWCSSFCPFGTVISSLSVINLLKPKIDQERCIDFEFNCLKCERLCPMGISVTKNDNWALMECNKCLECWVNCPVKAIKIGF